MLIIPTTNEHQGAPGHHDHGRRLGVIVENDDEGGMVRLTVDVDPPTLLRRGGPRPDEEAIARAIAVASHDPASVVHADALTAARTLATEVVRLTELLDSLTDDVDVMLEAPQARALAAALCHYAEEAERR